MRAVMAVPPIVRSLLPLVIGLGVGALGASMFLESMPGAAGSDKERVDKLEAELKKAQSRIASLAAVDADGRVRSQPLDEEGNPKVARRISDDMRRIVADVKAGRPVSPDDVFKLTKPAIRDLAPLFERMRLKDQQARVDALTGEYARKYGLNRQQQAELNQWFHGRMNEMAKEWTDLMAKDSTRLEDVVRATQATRPDRGIEKFMQGMLPAEKYAAFRAERLNESAARVQQEADRKVEQLNRAVKLDEGQRDQIFGLVARSSPDYDPAMQIDGVTGPVESKPVGDRRAAILDVLRPDQRAQYEVERQRQREQAEKQWAGVGLRLPDEWQIFDDVEF